MGARALTLVDEQTEHFNIAWRGYDRAEVDAFLERTAADRKRLQADLAQLEAAIASHDVARRHELERLAELRRELARCLETSINALHVANLLLASPVRVAEMEAPEAPHTPEAAPEPEPAPSVELVPLSPAETHAETTWRLPSWLSPGRTMLLITVGLSGTVGLVMGTDANQAPAAVVAPSLANVPESDVFVPAGLSLSLAAPEPIAAPAPIAAPVAAIETPSSAVPTPDPTSQPGSALAPAIATLEITLTAVSECWIRTTIDGGEPRERLLQPNESVTLSASEEAVLRIGDPAALLLDINGRRAKTLGSAGRVVTARITPANYLDFLSGN